MKQRYGDANGVQVCCTLSPEQATVTYGPDLCLVFRPDFPQDAIACFEALCAVKAVQGGVALSMTPSDYQHHVQRTMRPRDERDKLLLCGFGLAGETGEVVDLLKKFLFNGAGIDLPREKLKEELGDVLWYLANLCTTLAITLEDVMHANLAKLHRRHPNGFVPRYESDSQVLEQPSAP
jgi:NTP pyrophosphatase (non-canonical NTP hydrolase)